MTDRQPSLQEHLNCIPAASENQLQSREMNEEGVQSLGCTKKRESSCGLLDNRSDSSHLTSGVSVAAPSITIPQLQSVLCKPPPERREGTQETHEEFTSLPRALPGVMEAVILWDRGLQWEEIQRSPGMQFFH